MEELLREKGLKATKGRLDVLRILKASPVPMRAMEVYQKTSQDACASLSTVYRILIQLTKAGLLQASLQQDESTYYEYKGAEHHHYIVCARCGKLSPIDDCPLDALDKHITQTTGYAITGHTFQLEGICPDCLKKE
ncbi:MAG: Fur family transcriptional regulator [Peptoniphilus sp.]|nr:Fur family transcriptional regulator [Peptoniphilus sp.]MDY3118255.1 Fur family transcriptional regulator [Peptoniphilus sp.]